LDLENLNINHCPQILLLGFGGIENGFPHGVIEESALDYIKMGFFYCGVPTA